MQEYVGDPCFLPHPIQAHLFQQEAVVEADRGGQHDAIKAWKDTEPFFIQRQHSSNEGKRNSSQHGQKKSSLHTIKP